MARWNGTGVLPYAAACRSWACRANTEQRPGYREHRGSWPAVIRPLHRADWLLENVLVVVAMLGMAAGFRSMPLSRASYTLIFLFLCLHTLGAHYTYSEVPCDCWWQRAFGFSRDGRCAPTHG